VKALLLWFGSVNLDAEVLGDDNDYFSLRTPLNGFESDFRSINFPDFVSRLVQSPVLGLNT